MNFAKAVLTSNYTITEYGRVRRCWDRFWIGFDMKFSIVCSETSQLKSSLVTDRVEVSVIS